MPIPKAIISRLAKAHPHSAGVLKAFVPLLEAQENLVRDLPPPALPELNRAAFTLGKAWMPAVSADKALYFDEAFLKAAPKKLASAAAKGLPGLKEEVRALGAWLHKNPEECRKLGLLQLTGTPRKIKAWAKKQGHDENAAALLALHLASTAARRLERAASKLVLPPWDKGYCPVCGSRPHGGCLKGKEGKRWLQCSLCRHEWLFSRTTCPICGQDDPKNLLLFFLEDNKFERAEGCTVCKHYLLCLDMRELVDASLELYLLCMMPLDMLMQDDGYIPAVAAGMPE